MASTQKVRLVVKDDDDVTVVDDEIDGDATGDQIFRAMISLCPFGLWDFAYLVSSESRYTVWHSGHIPPRGEGDESVTEVLQRIMDRLPPSEELCRFTLEVQKRGDRRSNGPSDPDPVRNPGLRPRHGPDYGGFETLARMRGTLARV